MSGVRTNVVSNRRSTSALVHIGVCALLPETHSPEVRLPSTPPAAPHNPRPTTRTRLSRRHWLRTCAEASRMRSGSQLTARRKRETHAASPAAAAHAAPGSAPAPAPPPPRGRLRRARGSAASSTGSSPRAARHGQNSTHALACWPEHAIDLLPTHRRAAPRVDPAEPIAAALPCLCVCALPRPGYPPAPAALQSVCTTLQMTTGEWAC